MIEYFRREIYDFNEHMTDESAKLIELGRIMVAMERGDVTSEEYEKLLAMINLSAEQLEISKQIPGYAVQN